jgi:hypothetical protein
MDYGRADEEFFETTYDVSEALSESSEEDAAVLEAKPRSGLAPLNETSSAPAAGAITMDFDYKIRRLPLVINEMHLDKFTKKYQGITIDNTKRAEGLIVEDLLQVFRYVDTSKSFCIYKKVNAKKQVCFEFITKKEMLAILESYHFFQKTTKGVVRQTYRDLFEKYKILFLAKGAHFEPRNESDIPDLRQMNISQLDDYIEFVNLFTGWQAKKIEEVDMNKILPVFRHIKKIFCSGDQECYHYMVKWMAHLVQKPTDKVPVGIILQSEQGAGKDLFFKWFIDYVLGEKIALTTQYIEAVVGRFNSLMENKMLVVVNEITSNGKNPKYQTYEIMKSLISEKKQKIERKGLEPITINSYSRFVFCSNSDKPIHIEDGDRRYFVLKFKKNPDQKYYTDLADLLENNVESAQDIANHFYTWLMNLDLTGFHPQVFPKTEAKEELRETCMGSSERFIRTHTWTGKILTTHLYKIYNDWCKDNNYTPDNNHYFGMNIRKYVSSSRIGQQYAKIRNDPSDNDKQIDTEVISTE